MAAYIDAERYSTNTSNSTLARLPRFKENDADSQAPKAHWMRRWGGTTLHHIKVKTHVWAEKLAKPYCRNIPVLEPSVLWLTSIRKLY